MTTIPIRYSCKVCALVEVELHVPERVVEDIRVWMDRTIRRVGRDHRRLSPACGATHVDLKIPTDGRQVIGGPVVN